MKYKVRFTRDTTVQEGGETLFREGQKATLSESQYCRWLRRGACELCETVLETEAEKATAKDAKENEKEFAKAEKAAEEKAAKEAKAAEKEAAKEAKKADKE